MVKELRLIMLTAALTILLVVLLITCGCQEQQVVNSQVELIQPQLVPKSKLAVTWVERYGSDITSVEHFNIVLSRLTLEQHSKVIVKMTKTMKKEMDDIRVRLVSLEALQETIIDPNQGDD